ncbi:MAG TPA: DUF1223 domain-containing protein [Thermohalobaculum sp.]|nr:DUF1223 domain-containing protein [Thermohalobaculum sp.]
MKKRAPLLAAAFAAGMLALPAVAARADVLVELFTSQGCSSCPPADRILADIARHDDVIALSFHVDYWDYLGWRDTFASPEHTRRQRDYRDAFDASVIYTPQIVIDGRRSVPATHEGAILEAIEAARVPEDEEPIRIEGATGMLEASLAPAAQPRPCTVWIAKYRVSETVAVERGENAGRTLSYHNVVTSLDRIGEWDGRNDETVMLPQPGPGEGVAIWLQEGPGGPVLAAAAHEG